MPRENDIDYWLDVTTTLLQRPLTEFPAAELAPALHHSFRPNSLTWAWRENEHDCGSASLTTDGLQVAPAAVNDSGQRLHLCYHRRGISFGLFVLTRAGADFDHQERDLARRLQHLIGGLYVQSRAQSRHPAPVLPGSSVQVALTGTEATVLALLAEGYTALGIARRLSNSPRTVHKHLEHIYRKLGVSDRLMAVQVAADLARARHPAPAIRSGAGTPGAPRTG